LREIAFPHPIYADRFLSDPSMQTLWRKNKPVAIETLQEARRDVMFSKPEHEMDLTERWIRRFALQNRQWSTCWYDRYRRDRAAHVRISDPRLAGRPRRRHPQHAAWIEAEAAQDADDHIPYRQEAALFANIYWSNGGATKPSSRPTKCQTSS
jgi:hypothetical protein